LYGEDITFAMEIASPIICRSDFRGGGSGPTQGCGLFFFASVPLGAEYSLVLDDSSIVFGLMKVLNRETGVLSLLNDLVR
jgi:hypothetical protein